eukprot:15353092-Ditylum_brightwellii.AAC.1
MSIYDHGNNEHLIVVVHIFTVCVCGIVIVANADCERVCNGKLAFDENTSSASIAQLGERKTEA